MEKKDIYELTNPQKSIWNTELFFNNTTVNNICVSGIINEDVNIEILKKAINLLVKENDSFRIKLIVNDSVPVQFFSEYIPFDIDVTKVENKKEFNKIEQQMVEEKFNLINSELYKFKIVKFPDNTAGIILNVHHMIADSWSLGITIQEIVKIYKTLLENKEYISDTFSYKNYIESEREYKNSKRFDKDKEFWNEYLSENVEPVSIPSINRNIEVKSSNGKRVSYVLKKDVMNKITEFCEKNKISNYVFFMSVFSIYIGNMTNTNKFLLGTPILNRLNFKDKKTAGMFVTTVPFKVDIENNTFTEFAIDNNINLMSILRHQKYSYTDIIEDARIKNPDISNLYNIAISYQITKARIDDIGNYTTDWTFNNNSLNDMNIHLYDANDTGELKVDYDFLTDKYSEKEIENGHNRIIHIIEQIIEHPDINVQDIEIVTNDEKEQIVNKFNNRKLKCPFDKNIIELFEEQVIKNENERALVYKDNQFTYKELNKIVNKFARFLKEQGINKNDIVGVYMNKNYWFIISILAIQKLGAAYTPMHPEYPEERVNYILNDCNSKVLITDQEISNKEYKIINPNQISLDSFEDTNLNEEFDSNTLCYVIYTSGSTGKPKGVMLTHRNLINFVYNFNECFNTKFSRNDNCLSLTNISFDVSVCEIFTPLTLGATLVIYPENTLTDIHMLCDLIEKEKITFLYLPPSVLKDVYEFIKTNNYKFYVEKMLVGVEAIKNLDLNNLLSLNKNLEIVNGYGPTETTICSTFYKYEFNKKNDEIVPIGYPLRNNDIYIVNKFNNLQPVGIPGELIISGDSVSLGYLNNLEKTEESFKKISKLKNDIFYKTGDISYWNEKGFLNFIGRQDSQIKFRGHRIELNEINNNIKMIKGVTNSITILKNINEIPCICSYLSNDDNIITEDYVKIKLNEILPYYMIPTHVVCMEQLPINKSGKVDKNLLPEVSITSLKFVEASTLTEIKVHQILCKLLNLNKISVIDNLFELGMDSLICIRFSLEIYNNFNINISIKDLFKYNTIQEISKYIDEADTAYKNEDVHIYPKEFSYPLSSAQKRIYYATKSAGENSLLYNVSGGLFIKEFLDAEKVNKIFNILVEKNSSLRTYFKIDNGEPRQFVMDSISVKINTYKNKDITRNNISTLINAFPKSFDLEFAPLLRVELHYIKDGTLILVDSHHIILDGTSLNILLKDFCYLYNNEEYAYNKEIEYKDYSIWEDNLINTSSFEIIRNYWKERFENFEIPVINLPYDYAVGEKRTFNGNKLYFKIDKKLFEKTERISKKYNVSLYMMFLTNLYLMLYKYTGQNNIIIGSPIEARNSIKLNDIIGMFVNNIALNLNILDDYTLENLIKKVKSLVLGSLTNQPYPYEMLLKDLNIPSTTSLFDVVFTFQNNTNINNRINNKVLELIPSNTHTSKFNLTFEIDPSTYNLNIEYNTDLFKKETICSFYNHYIYLLENFVRNLNTKVSEIDSITKKEDELLAIFNKTDGKINNDTVVSIIEEQVKKHPNNIAVICDDKTLTYRELNDKANSLAHVLIEKGIQPNDIVCIMTNRSLETIVCMLGILKAGAAFLNVDPTYPIDRTKYYLENSKTQYVLTQACLKEKVKEIENCIEIDLENDLYNKKCKNPNVKVQPNDLSYIIYTSGSTGTPKGVMLNQVGFANMAKAMTKVLDYLKEGNKHCLISVTSTPFDIFVYEIIVSLTHGLKILMANNAEHRNPVLLDALIKRYNGDVMTVTPSLMKINYDNRLQPSALSNVKHMVFGGEPLPEKFVSDLRELSEGVTIYNIYGPSEITILSNVQKLEKNDKITVGPPIMNTQIHILDKFGKRVPIGVVGEIYISGIQVGRGYLGKPEMTKERFLDNPFGEGKMYKSGDIGRWTFDGKVQCLGRVDHQIKLRGLRIELGEIENKMESIKGVIASVVNKVEYNGKEVLCGYYVCDKEEVTEQIVKEYLRKELPYYMVPTYIMKLKEMPYTINRKIDRKALPLPHFTNNKNKDIISDKKLSVNEKKLLDIWKNVLNSDNISIDDNFFDIGGDSISAITMQLEAMKCGFEFEYSDIFNYPTIKMLSSKVYINSEQYEELKDYDYSKINNILKRNDVDSLKDIHKFNVKNILLIGGTGYLGAHLINAFLNNEKGKIYCLVRPKNNVIASERLKNTLNFYFGDNYYENNIKRIHILEGDIAKKNMGLSKDNIELLKKEISTIINSGAIVKHFGQRALFEKINVEGTKNILELCKKLEKRLIHISTISISGNGEKENSIDEKEKNSSTEKVFTERDIYVGQNLNGVYTITKFEAERIILEEIANGLDAQILRIGNIVNRYSDGKFQINTSENAFASRIKSFINIGAFPEYALKHAIELTPVDLCANAIIKILQNNSKANVFHIYNTKLMSIKSFYEVLSEMGINILPVSEEKMTDIIEKLLNDPLKKNILSGVIPDIDANKHLVYTSNITLESSFTEEYLKQIGFSWDEIDQNYITKYIEYFRKIKFIE